MPRGLGDDPLSRERKSGKDRPVASDAPPLDPVMASPDAPSVQPFIREELVSETSASSQPPSSYNDVFFQRRSEEGLEDAPAMNDDTPPPVAESVAQPTEATEIGRVPVGTALAEPPRSQGEVDAALAKTPIAPGEAAKTGQPKTEEQGFFRRIFGRLGQQSH